MGRIIKQSFWSTIITYAGVVIGYINTLFVKTSFLTTEQVGNFGLISSNGAMLSPIATLGLPSTYLRLFPSFPTQKERNQLFTLMLLTSAVALFLLSIVGFLCYDLLAAYYMEEAAGYIDFFGVTYIVILANFLYNYFSTYSRSIFLITFPTFLKENFLKFWSLIVLLCFGFEWISFEMAANSLGLSFLIAVLGLLLHMYIKGLRIDFGLSFIKKINIKEVFWFSGYSFLNQVLTAFIANITYNQISAMLGSSANGIFQICLFIGLIVDLPRRNLIKIIPSSVSIAMQKGDMALVRQLSFKASINMGVIGLLFFIGIITSISDLFAFIPNGSVYATGFWVVILVSCTKLFFMLVGIPSTIITFSKVYRYNLYLQVLSLGILLFLNSVLIEVYGITGAGISYSLALVIPMIARYVVASRITGSYIFNEQHLKLFAIGILTCLLGFFFKTSFHPLSDIAVRSILEGSLFLSLVYFMKISKDINAIIDQSISQAKQLLKGRK